MTILEAAALVVKLIALVVAMGGEWLAVLAVHRTSSEMGHFDLD